MSLFINSTVGGLLVAGILGVGCSTFSPHAMPSREVASQANSVFKGEAWAVVAPTELARYSEIWGLTDLHGRQDAFENLLSSAKLISDNSGNGRWVARKMLLVITGDYIDGGDESAQVLLRVKALMPQAEKLGSRIIPLLGNHEARFLADPRPKNLEKATLKSFAKALNTDSKELSGDAIEKSDLGKFMSQLKVGAVVGTWLFAHSGSLRTKVKDAPQFIESIGATWSLQSRDGFTELSDEDGKGVASILARHDWWDNEKDDLREVLQSLGIDGLIVGHEASLMGGGKYREHIVTSNKGWAIKIDTGLKDNPKNQGEILRCPRASDGSFKLTEGDHSVCLRHAADGRESSLDQDH